MDVGVNVQRKTRGEAVYLGVGGWHIAHVVVRVSVNCLSESYCRGFGETRIPCVT